MVNTQGPAYCNIARLYSTASGQICIKLTSLEFQIMDSDSFDVLIALENLNDIILMLFSLIGSQWVDCALLLFSSSQQLTQAFSPSWGKLYLLYTKHRE